MQFNMDEINWDKVNGMLPVIVQHDLNGQVLMQGYMDQAALTKTITSGKVTFYSRTKQRLWTKGEQSGHFLNVQSLCLDCDHDCLLIQAKPQGPTCHLGSVSCFNDKQAQPFIMQLAQIINSRKNEASDASYTSKLFTRGTKRIAQKVGEEGLETALAAATNDKAELINEASDLLFHLLVLLEDQQLDMDSIYANLQQRNRSMTKKQTDKSKT
ncbi:bifunctional phosphoribosyl-AMP cyclohydrolase/phosphoribosyl-ATP diphosphatase HisIE [Shewanella marina]|uniref:bifunctional phosphoribosyl-AMP cyclohydrolase/phosphoribosyl-ATP diphosphatase HisIE n=1 Tax=Shewanella marina TaxID=487319 RepID=UPI0005602805|nr:bifunctional phosphoribosyl-AMP cyclohydrolase/phosphoribosyl-ATP diphosphatase HisIE [Shewanella marina]